MRKVCIILHRMIFLMVPAGGQAFLLSGFTVSNTGLLPSRLCLGWRSRWNIWLPNKLGDDSDRR